MIVLSALSSVMDSLVSIKQVVFELCFSSIAKNESL